MGREVRGDPADDVGRDRHHDQAGVGGRLGQRPDRPDRLGQADPGQEPGVLPRLAERRQQVGLVDPQPGGVARPGRMDRQGGSPRARPDDGQLPPRQRLTPPRRLG
jgi:hypothetical protein